jgi:hypothetical protein
MRTAIVVVVVIVMSGCATGATSLLDTWPNASDAVPYGSVRESAVVDSFPSPGTKPMGLDYYDVSDMILHVDEARGDVYEVYPDGSAHLLFNVLDETGYPESADCGNGICHVAHYPAPGDIYVTDYNGHKDEPGVDRVYKFHPDITRQEWVWESWDVSAFADGVVGVASAYGSTFWLTTAGGEIIECNEDFEEMARYSIPGFSGGGIDYDTYYNRCYLIDYLTGDVHVCDSAFNVLYSFDGHPTATNMVGVTVGRSTRGRSVWTSTFGSTDPLIDPFIFEIDDEFYSPVEASSWGRVKAAYR